MAELTKAIKTRIRELLELAPGLRVLDVGCGPGVDATAVAERVRPDGLVAAVDYDPVMIADACDARRWGSSLSVRYAVADAGQLPYRPEVFDRCYCERVLQHVPDPAAVIREMIRVTQPGGLVVVADSDWGSLSIDAPDEETERALVRFAGATVCNGYAGRQLRRLLKQQGLAAVGVEVWPVVWTDYATFCGTTLSLVDMDRRAVESGALRAADLARFDATLRSLDRRGLFYASGSLVIARGRKVRHTTVDRRRGHAT